MGEPHLLLADLIAKLDVLAGPVKFARTWILGLTFWR
jgi:hypothetical protein